MPILVQGIKINNLHLYFLCFMGDMYLFIGLCCIVYIGKNVFSAIIYGLDFRKKTSGSMVEYSQIFCVIDSLSTLFLQGLMIFIPFLWLKSISILLEKMKRNQQKDKIINKISQIYLIIRNILYATLFIIELLMPQIADPVCTTIIMLIMFESFISLLLLSYGILKLSKHFTPDSISQQKSKKRFKQNYLIMIGCSLMRFILDFYFIIYQQIEDDVKNCFNYRNDDYAYTSVYLIFGSILMHLLPISMILHIHRIDFKKINYKRMNDEQDIQ